LLTLVLGVAVTWLTAVGSGRLFDTYGLFQDVETSTANTFTAGELEEPTLDDADPNSQDGSVELTWTFPNGDVATHVIIERADSTCSSASENDFDEIDTVLITAEPYVDDGLDPGSYCYRIRGQHGNWTSPVSNKVGVTLEEPQTAILLPDGDKANGTGPLNKWTNNSGGECAATTTTCTPRINDSDDATYILHGSIGAPVTFELDDAPNDLETMTDANVKFKARLGDINDCDLTVGLYKSNGTLLDEDTQSLTSTFTTYDFDIASLDLDESDVDGLYVKLENSGTGICQVSKVSVEITYWPN
jgi:hypothetical protein